MAQPTALDGLMALPEQGPEAVGGGAPGGQPLGAQQPAMDPRMLEMNLNQFAQQHPEQMEQIKQALMEAMQTGELTAQELNMMVQLATVAMQDPSMYPRIRQYAIQQGVVTDADLPQQYDQGLIFSVVLAGRALQGGEQAAPEAAPDAAPDANSQGQPVPSMAKGGQIKAATPGCSRVIEGHDDEYVVPANVVRMKGREFFDNLVAKYQDQ
jgi:hypothetical protein